MRGRGGSLSSGVVPFVERVRDYLMAMKLKDVLADPDAFEWSLWLYLPREDPWSPESEAMVLDTDDLAPDEDDPPEAIEAGMKSALGIQTVQDLVVGVPNTPQDRFAAFAYYHVMDAAIQDHQLAEWKARYRDRPGMGP